ncbi:MAG: sigma 54-interacting transcriptional regulator [Acidobacteriota bacterium]
MREVRGAEGEPERFSIDGTRERWLGFLSFEHATLPPPLDYARDGNEIVVSRASVPLRRVAMGRVAVEHGPALFLQGAAVVAALSAAGTWAAAADLLDAAWDVESGLARLWLGRTPGGVAAGGAAPPPSEVLVPYLERLFGRGGRVRDENAAALLERLTAPPASRRRPEFWLAEAYRSFPALSEARTGPVRERTAGSFAAYFRTAAARALIEKGRAILTGGRPRVFHAASGALDPGAAIGHPGSSGWSAARELRLEASDEAGARRSVWICVAMDRWDAMSRSAVRVAALSADPPAELVTVDEAVPAPSAAGDWRSAIYVPCGTVRASLRFSERLAEVAERRPGEMPEAALRRVRDPGWASFVADPTGDAPLPEPRREGGPPDGTAGLTAAERRLWEALAVLDGPPSRGELEALFPTRSLSLRLRALERRLLVRIDRSGLPEPCPVPSDAISSGSRRGWLLRWAGVSRAPGRRVSWLLDAGELGAALGEARAWIASEAGAPPERWFELSARLAAAHPGARPPWLEALEAEREIAGGRPAAAEVCLRRVVESLASSPEERRAAGLRLAEIAAARGRARAAAEEARSWRAAHPDAPPAETARALRLEAAASSRQGDPETALALLARADALAAGLSAAELVEVRLARAAVLSRAGRFEEEQFAYAAARQALSGGDDESGAARILAAEALGLSDRREFDAAIDRLERALEILKDDAVDRAKVTIDLAATLHHAGRGARALELLREAADIALGAGREDLARLARSNIVEESLDRGDFPGAEPAIEELLRGAEREGDPVWRLVALHHRSRLALRRGRLEDSARDNREARELASALGDRLEIGELWLEEGDRVALEGEPERAREAWERAAALPSDRGGSAARARDRLAEAAELGGSQFPPEKLARAGDGVARGDYAAAESVARWARLVPRAVPPSLAAAAAELLRSAGGEALADLAFPGSGRVGAPTGELRRLREIVAAALEGEAPDVRLPLGIHTLAISSPAGDSVVALGDASDTPPVRRVLQAGSDEYELRVAPALAAADLDAVVLLLETLLFRSRPAPADEKDFAGGWARLGVITGDAAMDEPYRRLLRFAPRAMTVLVLGESGSGKEAAARAVHALSPRARAPFIGVNVSAIPTALVESELFGHARGAFTGADRDRPGLFEAAAGGTIFFDEIGDLAGPVQSKLLRALQDREIRRVGENRSRGIDVRVVSATSLDLAREVEAGRFREDLYYRLHVAVVRLPALRDRGRDPVLLARHFLAQCGRDFGRPDGFELAPDATAALLAHTWPGNVRELQSAVTSAAALTEGHRVAAASLPETVRRASRPSERGRGYRSRVDAHRRDLIMEALDRSGGNRTRAARDLKLSRQALLYLIRQLRVPSPPGRPAASRS